MVLYEDEKEETDVLLAPTDHSRMLVFLSQLALISGLIGIYYGWTWCGIGVCIGSFISQMYWSNPRLFSWRRILDIVWVQLLIWTHLAAAWNTAIFLPYVLLQLVGVGFFVLSWNWFKQERQWESTITHMCVHICANTTICLLYIFG
jgi:hypothetical protein